MSCIIEMPEQNFPGGTLHYFLICFPEEKMSNFTNATTKGGIYQWKEYEKLREIQHLIHLYGTSVKTLKFAIYRMQICLLRL